MKRTTQHRNGGQVLLITLLVLTFALTVAISLIARTTTDISITNQNEDSAKAFSAAEAGIEVGMSTSADSSQSFTTGAKYNVAVTDLGGSAGVLAYPKIILPGSVQTVWLADHNDDGSLNEARVYTPPYIDVCWTNSGAAPAIVVSILYKRAGAYLMAKDAFDPDGARRAIDAFAAPTSTSAGRECGSADNRARIIFASYGINPAADTLFMMRIRPIYAGTSISLDSTVALPLQGKSVVSTGSAGGGVTRKIVVFQQYRSLDSVFDASLYSEKDLVQ